MSPRRILLVVLGIFFVNSTNGLNILAIFPISMKSHYAIGFSVIQSLLDVGHNMTAISNLKPDKPIANYRVIPIPDVMEAFKGL
jgi:glucuronosyltransferase